MAETEQVLEIENQDDLALVERMQEGREKIVAEIKKVIIGQESIIDELQIHDNFPGCEYQIGNKIWGFEIKQRTHFSKGSRLPH